jgi:predicted ester cyclase
MTMNTAQTILRSLLAVSAVVAGCAHQPAPSEPAAPANRETARREIQEFEGRGETAVADEVFGPGYRLHFPGYPDMDREGHKQLMAAFRSAFPDLSVSVQFQIAQGDRIANHVLVTGTHLAVFQGIPATQRRISITGNNVMRFEHGKIVELWGNLDVMGMLQQLGVMPSDGRPPVRYPAESPAAQGSAKVSAARVRDFVDRFNAKDFPGLTANYADDYVLDFPGGPVGQGRAGIEQATRDFAGAFPDLQFTVDDLLAEGDRVAWRWTMTGTHRGKLGPFAPTEKQVRLTGISLFRLRDSLIIEDRVRADMVGLLTQIGVIPPPK